jgi:hypothetical protein
MERLAVLDFGQLLQAFTKDDKLRVVVILIAVDVLLGVIAALKMKKFTLSYVADFMRNDVLYKVVPWFILYSAGKLTSKDTIPGIDFATLADGAFGLIVAALVGSIGSSLYQLGLKKEEAQNLAAGGTAGNKPGTTTLGPENPATQVDLSTAITHIEQELQQLAGR